MTQGFYEQLGVGATSSADEIRAAYQRLVTAQIRRRKKIVEEGGDTSGLDLARSQADEAWSVLSDQERRRQYDAMLALGDERIDGALELWENASSSLVSPAAGAAAELLRRSTTLRVGELPSGAPSLVEEAASNHEAPIPPVVEIVQLSEVISSDTQVPVATEFPSEPGSLPSASVFEFPSTGAGLDSREFRVVDGSPDASPVLVLPSSAVRETAISTEDILHLVEEHGFTGSLLRAVREARKISLQDMSDTTRISARYLEAIESDEHDVLPSATFVRGYIREMSRMLGMETRQMVEGYMARYER
jgi:hypothetical protein